MNDAALHDAYERFHRTGPEWGEDQLTNHGPMAVEVLVRRGRADLVDRWTDRYIRRLDELPSATGRITDADWTDALGDGRRIGDWTAYFADRLAERPWRAAEILESAVEHADEHVIEFADTAADVHARTGDSAALAAALHVAALIPRNP